MGWPETPAPLPARIASRNVNTQVVNDKDVEKKAEIRIKKQVLLFRLPAEMNGKRASAWPHVRGWHTWNVCAGK